MLLHSKNKNITRVLFFLAGLVTLPTTAFSQPDSFVIQAGVYLAAQGKSQNIGINTLIGDSFTLAHHSDQSFLLGLGYFTDSGYTCSDEFDLLYGIDAFVLTPITIKGDVIQEHLFTNLAYKYSITNYPIYAVARIDHLTDCDLLNITADIGVGVNFIHTDDFRENSLDGGITIPDNAFSARTTVVPSAEVGIGVKLNHLYSQASFECGYHFFYLGQGELKVQNSQFNKPLKTGDSYANALVCSVAL